MSCSKTLLKSRLCPSFVQEIPAKDSWKLQFSFEDAMTVGYGISGRVLEINRALVIKSYAQDEEGQKALRCEKLAYETLQGSGHGSNCVVTFEEEWRSGLVLERLRTTLRLHLKDLLCPPSSHLTRLWARETSQGLAFLHSKEIFHGDLGCDNILINAAGHVKLCDFAGSKIGVEDGWVCYEVRSQHPLHRGEQPTVTTELFALGSALFEMCTSLPPYAKEPNMLVRQKYTKGEFPLTYIEDDEIRVIVEGCWRGIYGNVSEVSVMLEKE